MENEINILDQELLEIRNKINLLEQERQKLKEQIDQYNLNEYIEERQNDEIDKTKKAQKELTSNLFGALFDMTYGPMISKNKSIEDEVYHKNIHVCNILRNLNFSPFESPETPDEGDDMQKYFELTDFLLEHYPNPEEEYNWNKFGTIQTNAKVYKLLLSGTFVKLNFEPPLSDATKWFDYSVLIIHFVKAVEKFLVYKLNNKKLLNNWEYHHITMGKITEKIQKHKEILFKKHVPGFIEQYYFQLLEDFRREYRNGYMHRDYLTYEKSQFINDMIIRIIVISDIILD